MGLEYPYLAIMSASLFIAIIVSMLMVTVWIEYQMKLAPKIEGYATFEWVDTNNATITITLRVTSGTPVTYTEIYLPTNQGVVTLAGPGTYTVGSSTISVRFEGFSGTIHLGQEAKIILDISNARALFSPGRQYQALISLDPGGHIVNFQPPPPTP